jgi:hypothetical protein
MQVDLRAVCDPTAKDAEVILSQLRPLLLADDRSDVLLPELVQILVTEPTLAESELRVLKLISWDLFGLLIPLVTSNASSSGDVQKLLNAIYATTKPRELYMMATEILQAYTQPLQVASILFALQVSICTRAPCASLSFSTDLQIYTYTNGSFARVLPSSTARLTVHGTQAPSAAHRERASHNDAPPFPRAGGRRRRRRGRGRGRRGQY